ncbi:MAG TPA: nuclear transport factor 2 family protein [Candidatus Acidoferrum sp.]|nr:nuclear transport factor 2 family protein [Candidatus Acidoferrum sp.]
MRTRPLLFLVVALSSASLLFSLAARSAFAADTDQAVLQADRKFVQAASLQNGSLLARMLDDDFTWTDSDGKTLTAAEVLHAVPKPALGDESGIDVTERTYGQVGAVQASRGKIHVLRMWVQQPGGWKLLVYHEVKQLAQPSTSAGSGVKECENPCKTVPFTPANEAEQAIIASWQALETGVTAHDAEAWAPHIAEEFVQISSNSDHPISKAGRIETLNKQKASGAGSAPAPLVSAKMFDFGDAVIMTCLHQPYSGKPVHVSRLWIKRDGKWIMSISYQTAIQAAAAK